MVSKCLNSYCSATFRYMGQGRLFRVDFADLARQGLLADKKVVISIRSKAQPVEHFWLCEKCSTTMTIKLSEAGEVQLVPLEALAQSPSAGSLPRGSISQTARRLNIEPLCKVSKTG
jgi:hypothetical protein